MALESCSSSLRMPSPRGGKGRGFTAPATDSIGVMALRSVAGPTLQVLVRCQPKNNICFMRKLRALHAFVFVLFPTHRSVVVQTRGYKLVCGTYAIHYISYVVILGVLVCAPSMLPRISLCRITDAKMHVPYARRNCEGRTNEFSSVHIKRTAQCNSHTSGRSFRPAVIVTSLTREKQLNFLNPITTHTISLVATITYRFLLRDTIPTVLNLNTYIC